MFSVLIFTFFWLIDVFLFRAFFYHRPGQKAIHKASHFLVVLCSHFEHVSVQEYQPENNWHLDASDDVNPCFGEFCVTWDEIVDEHHFAKNSDWVQGDEGVVAKSRCQGMVFEQVVQVAITVGKGPDDSDSGKSQTTGGGFSKSPGNNQPAYNLEECTKNGSLTFPCQYKHNIHNLKSLNKPEHMHVHLNISGDKAFGIPEERNADMKDQIEPAWKVDYVHEFLHVVVTNIFELAIIIWWGEYFTDWK